MKKILQAIVLLVVVFILSKDYIIPTILAPKNDSARFLDIQWGANRDNVAEIMAAKGYISVDKINESANARISYSGGQANDNAEVIFTFINNQLFIVNVKYPTKETEELYKMLLKDYGEPSESLLERRSNKIEVAVWKFADSVLAVNKDGVTYTSTALPK